MTTTELLILFSVPFLIGATGIGYIIWDIFASRRNPVLTTA
jgi:hypothetical protein